MSGYVDLDDMEADFKNAKTNSFSPIPDGTYQVEVVTARFKELGSNRLFEWILRTLDSDKKITKTNLLRPDLMHWLKSDLKACGWEAQSLQEIQQKCSVKLPGMMLEVKVENKEANGKRFQNVYIQKCLTPPPEQQQEQQKEQPPPPKEDDIPF